MSAEVRTDTAFILYVALLVGILANIPAKPKRISLRLTEFCQILGGLKLLIPNSLVVPKERFELSRP